jgi:hypothetical protein
MKIIGAKDMPDFIEALESYSLKNPGTVAQLGLRIAGSEDLQKLVICRHPELKFGLNAKWEWEYTPMNQPRGQKPDSCVVLYWAEEMMPAGATRVMAFTYGLGTISSTGGDSGNLAVTLGGSFQPGRVFTVTAYIKDAEEGQRATLRLPGELTLEENETTAKPVRPEAGGLSQVTWRVRARDVGQFPLDVTLTDAAGRTQASAPVRVEIRRASLFN